ncbi:MAG: hypothetical protein ACOCW5_01175 [Spirochaetia bacterium]
MKTAEHLSTILQQEVDGFSSAIERAETIRSSIFKHDWKQLSESIEKMERLSGYLAALEKERDHVFEKLRSEVKASPSDGFYTVVVRLEREEQETLSSLFRKLKTKVIQLQGVIWSIDAYTRSISTTIYDILQEIFPHKRGTMYSKSGKKRKIDNDPLVVNHQL